MSVWRRRAGRAIADALATVPAGATPEDMRAAIDGAYPFGVREHHPYKVWLKVRREVFESLGLAEKKAPRAPSIEFAVWRDIDGGYQFGVSCGWCRGKFGTGGCLLCLEKRREARGVLQDPLLVAILRSASSDPVARAALGDYLEERLQTRCGL